MEHPPSPEAMAGQEEHRVKRVDFSVSFNYKNKLKKFLPPLTSKQGLAPWSIIPRRHTSPVA
jgi:hypothetical protein